ncbi:MAG: GTPase HflX [Alphaproteobacteria bacterium]|nr:GTPase HflX [Alphaproteobacteria bacterium]
MKKGLREEDSNFSSSLRFDFADPLFLSSAFLSSAYILEPVLPFAEESGLSLDSSALLAEVIGLAEAISIRVVGSQIVNLRKAHSGSFFGKGKVQEIKDILPDLKVDLVIVGTSLSPVQQRNLEMEWCVKVIDRVGLILEIFSARARSREGRLQVELARLNYQKSRLVRSWTHLERQRGGRGFLTGPGETQIESDRRQIRERIERIEARLGDVRRRRALHSHARKKVPYPVIAMVGYTNAGKSSLFNRLTDSNVFCADLLFATLDTTLRQLRLPSGLRVILSDTVGFISNLPTHLVAAFRATLEEIVNADIILHIRDVSHPDSEAQACEVRKVLALLADSGEGRCIIQRNKVLEGEVCPHIFEVWNKIDLFSPEERLSFCEEAEKSSDVVAVSAVSGDGLEVFLNKIDHALTKHNSVYTVRLPAFAGREINWLYENCDVMEKKSVNGNEVVLRVCVPQIHDQYFNSKFDLTY